MAVFLFAILSRGIVFGKRWVFEKKTRWKYLLVTFDAGEYPCSVREKSEYVAACG